MEAIIVGDLHGNLNFYRKVRAQEQGKVILVGDLLDSRHFIRAEQLELLKIVLDDVEKGTTECVFGNHELSYLIPGMRCSGYASSFDARIIHLKSRMWKLMKPYIFDTENGVLITHAGLTNNLLIEAEKMDGFTWTTFEDLESFLAVSWRQPLYDDFVCYIGHARGGHSVTGGIFWCDWNHEFQPVPNLTQIFGHTPVGMISRMQTNWNIDCVESGKNDVAIKLTGNKVEAVHYEDSPSKAASRSKGSSRVGGQEEPTGTAEEAGPQGVESREGESKASEENRSSEVSD